MLAGVLNCAIDGWARLLDQDIFTGVESHDETRRLWQSWGESVEQFIAECVERDEDADRITTGGAYTRYQAWCRQNGADSVGRRRFTDTLIGSVGTVYQDDPTLSCGRSGHDSQPTL
jgi:putative DNA primase/helicase